MSRPDRRAVPTATTERPSCALARGWRTCAGAAAHSPARRRSFPSPRSPSPATAPDGAAAERTVRVTHPFHPWCGREFVFVVARRTWGEDRVFFLDEDGVQRSLLRSWTDAADVDPFVVVAAGRCRLRVCDLVELVELIGAWR